MENSDGDTVVGNLVAIDEDVGQSHIYKLLDTAGGRFKIVNNQVKVVTYLVVAFFAHFSFVLHYFKHSSNLNFWF